jgi:hypothetical protein
MVVGKRKVVSRNKRRKRMSSSEEQSEMSDQSPVSTVSNEQFWDFLRGNSQEIVSRIVASAGWHQYIADRDDTVKELREENKLLRQKLAVTEGTVTRCELQVQKLEEKITDLTCRSMRDNIIIKNINETEGEFGDVLENKVLGVLQKELHIPSAEMSKLIVERVHRTGVLMEDRIRNVIAKLNSKGKSVVMSHIKNLDKNSPIKINEQFPPQVHANRDKLWPVYLEAKKQNKKARWNVDQLQIEGKTLKPPVDKRTDINLDVTEESLKLVVKSTAVTTKKNTHLQGHTVEITSMDDVVPALKALCSDTRISGASNVMYAYRIGSDRHSLHNWEDDGEFGAGKRIMEAITGNNIYNKLVCVTKWNGSQYIGPDRFDMIKERSEAAIALATP